MKKFSLLALLLLLAGIAGAQQPHLAYVYPAGGCVGTTFQVVVGGQALLTASNAFVSGTGISAKVLESSRPMNFQEFQKLRDRLRELQEKFQATRKGNVGTNIWTTADTAEREMIHAKILKNPPNRTANPAMIDTVVVNVVIATNAAPGDHEIRLATPNFLSNPLKFCVGELPEITKTAARPTNPDLDKFLEKIGGRPATTGTPKYEARVTLPAIINGQIMPGGLDRYRFTAHRGQELIIAASARTLMPYLADAVPGWFEATLTIYDAAGKELASDERFRFKPDPVIRFEVPRDGEYVVAIHDSIFRGREDFIYRLSIGELPFVTGIFPLGGKAGEKTTVTLTGWNLPEKKITVQNPATTAGIISLPVASLYEVPFAVDNLPEIFEHEPNHAAETAQTVTLPVIVNGHIGKAGVSDVFKFEGRAGQAIVAEVLARRLDSPLDSFLRLTDATGKQLAFNDDFEDKGSGLETHHADSYLTATLPVDGTYFIHLTDTQGQGGPEFAYRLRISEPRPDFALRVVPSSLSLRPGMSATMTVFAVRHDGFTNAINLELKTAPPDFSLSGARLPENQDKVQFTLKGPLESLPKPTAISLVGTALVGGAPVTRPAAPAEDMMQAFIYRHLVPSRELAVTVTGPARMITRDSFKLLTATPVKIRVGEKTRIRISTPTAMFLERFKLELNNPPNGVSLESVAPNGSGIELVLAGDPEKLEPGASGNLIFDVLQAGPAGQKSKKPGNQSRRIAVASLPAIPFKVIAGGK